VARRWPRSHQAVARKAFERATKRVLPASHLALQRALAAEARSYSAKVAELEKRARSARASRAEGDDNQRHDVAGADDGS
jgi:hypothetical protein